MSLFTTPYEAVSKALLRGGWWLTAPPPQELVTMICGGGARLVTEHPLMAAYHGLGQGAQERLVDIEVPWPL